MLEYVFNALGLDYRQYIKLDPRYERAEELNLLKGYASQAIDELKWNREYTLEQTLDDMILSAQNEYK